MGVGEVNYDKLPDSVKKRIEEVRANRPDVRQLNAIEDLADIAQELLGVVDEMKASGQSTSKEMGAILLDVRESLAAIKGKKDPEVPDYAKPVVKAISDMEKAVSTAVSKIDVKPVVNVPKLDAPAVNVAAPRVDLKGVEDLIAEIPKAFSEAIKQIPETEIPESDYTPLVKIMERMSTQLQDIDTGVRIKPQMPTTLKVTNPDGTSIGHLGLIPVPFSRITWSNANANTPPNYLLGTVKSGATTVGTLTFDYDGDGTLLDVYWTAV